MVSEAALTEGTTFSFTVEMQRVPDAEQPRRSRNVLAGLNALVVDDNETNRTILHQQLVNWGMQVELVSDAFEALEALNSVRLTAGQVHDVAVLDLHMPDMDGIELARRISADSASRDRLRMIMLTSAVTELSQAELLEIGIRKHISKPVRQNLLRDSMASLVSGVEPRDVVRRMPPGVCRRFVRMCCLRKTT